MAAGDAGPADTMVRPTPIPTSSTSGPSNNFRFYAETGTDGYVPPIGQQRMDQRQHQRTEHRGFAQSGPTVDLVAPGDTSFAACTPDVKMYADCTNWTGAPRRSSSRAAPVSRRP